MGTSTWEASKERAENHKGSGIFVRLADDGDKVTVVFVGDPFVRELVWNQKTNQYDDFTKEHEKAGIKPAPRYVVNVFVPAENAMKVMEFSNATFKDVLKAKEKYGIDKRAFEIERSGKKGDTKTSYSILPEDPFGPEIVKAIAEAKMHDLTKVGSDGGDESTDMSSHDKKTNGSSNGTAAKAPEAITADQSAALVGRLKPMDKAKIEEFLKTFKVAKIKELKAGDLAAATTLIDTWEGKGKAQEEVDPFA